MGRPSVSFAPYMARNQESSPAGAAESWQQPSAARTARTSPRVTIYRSKSARTSPTRCALRSLKYCPGARGCPGLGMPPVCRGINVRSKSKHMARLPGGSSSLLPAREPRGVHGGGCGALQSLPSVAPSASVVVDSHAAAGLPAGLTSICSLVTGDVAPRRVGCEADRFTSYRSGAFSTWKSMDALRDCPARCCAA